MTSLLAEPMNYLVAAGLQINWGAIASITSASAALVALCIASLPILSRKKHAKAVAGIVFVKLEQQSLFVGATRYVAKHDGLNGTYSNSITIALEQLDPSGLRELIPFFDVLPKNVALSLAACIVDTETVVMLVSRAPLVDPNTDRISLPKYNDVLPKLEDSLDNAIVQLERFTKRAAPDRSAAKQQMGESLRIKAELAHRNSYNERKLRELVLGRG